MANIYGCSLSDGISMESSKLMPRPDYCPDDLDETKDCPACGEPPSGVCRARFNKSKPKPWIEIILVDRDTGEPI